jgi:serine/threonine-protein kinase
MGRLVDLTGSTVGRFKITGRIGAGGMGEVYSAEDSQLKRTVAIKRLSPHIDDKRSSNELLKEAQRASGLNHPGIAGVYDIVAEDNELFLVMEYVDGITLRQRLETPIGLSEFYKIAIQCAGALAAAHEKGIVHGDLKPENIILTHGKSDVKVCDFGLSHRSSENESTKNASTVRAGIAGTPSYMAPEVALERPTDVRADIFSLGVVFYEMLAGKNPFAASSFIATIDRIRVLSPEPLDQVNSSVSSELAQLIARMIQKDPAKRYANAADLLTDLSRIKNDSSSETQVKVKQGRSWLYAAALIVLSAIVAVILQKNGLQLRTHSDIPQSINLTVIPFSVIGTNQDNQSFGEGLTETLNVQLSRLTVGRKFQVTTATEARTRGVMSASDARQQFGSNLALTGSFQYSNTSVRINCLLIETASGRTLRTETITGDTFDPFALQDRVIASVLRMIGLELKPEERDTLASHGTQQPSAYDFYLQGRGYLQNFDRAENLDNAIGVFRRATESDPRYALAYAGLGEAYWHKYESTKSTVWVEPARAACEGALAIDPKIAEPHGCLGMVLNGLGENEKAAGQFRLALDTERTNDLFYVGLANAYEQLGRPADAEQTFRRAIELRPHYWAGYSFLGVYFYRNGRYDEAEQMFSRVVELVPDSFRGYSNLGAVQFEKDEGEAAKASFERSLSIRPSYPAASNLGTLYYFEEQYELAAAMFREALSLNQSDDQVWGNLGFALRQMNRPDDSREAYRHAKELVQEQLRLNAHNTAAQVALADYLAALGDKPAALELIRKAETVPLDEPNTLLKLAIFYEEHMHDREEALKWLQRAIDHHKTQTWRAIDHSPPLSKLRQDPRFKELRNRERTSH